VGCSPSPTLDKGDYQGRVPSDATAILPEHEHDLRHTPLPAPGLTLIVADPEPRYAATPTSDEDRRRELEDAHTRLLARAVGDQLPYELALRAAELVAQLERTA